MILMDITAVEQLGKTLFEPDIIAGGLIWPFLIIILKFIIDLANNMVIVNKYKEEVISWNKRYFIAKLWQIILAPVGFGCAILFFAMTIIDSSWNNNLLFTIVILFLVFMCMFALPGSVKEKLQIILKTIIEIVMCSILFIILSAQYGNYGEIFWFLTICVVIQITLFEYHILVDSEDVDLNIIIIKLFEYALSIMWYLCGMKSSNNILNAILLLISLVVVFLDVSIRKNKNEQPVKKTITVCELNGQDKEYFTYDSIKRSHHGDLYFRDNNNCKIIISLNYIKHITFEYTSKLRLSSKITNFKLVDNPTKKLEGEWYVKSIMSEWLWISSWEDGTTKNVIYPRNNVLWMAEKCNKNK